MSEPLIKKDFFKLDVYRFDIEHLVDDLYDINVSNAISWDYLTIRATKNELKGLADFVNSYLEGK